MCELCELIVFVKQSIPELKKTDNQTAKEKIILNENRVTGVIPDYCTFYILVEQLKPKFKRDKETIK